MDWQDFRVNTRLNTIRSTDFDKMLALIVEIDSIKASWRITKKLSPQVLERLTQSVIITSTGASNRIEGNRLTDEQVEAIYKNIRITKFKTRDDQEVVGYLEMLKFIFADYKDIPFTESFILQLHQHMLQHVQKDEAHRGRYKVGSNRVEAKDASGNIVGIVFDPTPPYLVKKEMQELIDWYVWALHNKIKHPLLLIANLIFEFLAIHPFQDGNGRCSRLLTNLLLLQNGYTFTTVVSHEKIIEDHKAEYYIALNKSQTSWKTEHENVSPWILFFLHVVKEQAIKALALLEGNTIEPLLSPKQLLLWQWIQQQQAHAEFSRKDLVAALGFPERTVESIVKKLLDLQRLERLGAGPATRYKLKS